MTGIAVFVLFVGLLALGFYVATLVYRSASRSAAFEERLADENKVTAEHVKQLDGLRTDHTNLLDAVALLEKRTNKGFEDVEKALKTKGSVTELGKAFR